MLSKGEVIRVDFAREREDRLLARWKGDGATLQLRAEGKDHGLSRFEQAEAERQRERRQRAFRAWVCRNYRQVEELTRPSN